MRIEDAIKTLKELWRETNDPWYEEVYNMAINALEADRKTEPQTEYDKYCEKIRLHDPHKDWYMDGPQTGKPCDNCQEFDCYGCEHKQTEREGD